MRRRKKSYYYHIFASIVFTLSSAGILLFKTCQSLCFAGIQNPRILYVKTIKVKLSVTQVCWVGDGIRSGEVTRNHIRIHRYPVPTHPTKKKEKEKKKKKINQSRFICYRYRLQTCSDLRQMAVAKIDREINKKEDLLNKFRVEP